MSKIFTIVILFTIKLYSVLISPFMPRNCRYYPTCSSYTYQAVEKLGIMRGLWLGLKRILRCNPFAAGGYDPVPEVQSLCILKENRRKKIEGIKYDR